MPQRTDCPPERRYFSSELRLDTRQDQSTLSGHAAVFNSLSEMLWGFREKIRPGAFSNSIKKDDIRALWNHDANFVLGRRKAGTLNLEEDQVGLSVRITPPDTQFASDLIQSIKRGDVDQMSFGFRTITDDWHHEDGMVIRELIEVELFDVSPVTFPAYLATDISARAATLYEARMKDLGPAPAAPVIIPPELRAPAASEEPAPEPVPDVLAIRNKLSIMRQNLIAKIF